MANLVKGQKADLTKNTEQKKFLVGLGWDLNKLGSEADLDAVAFLLGENGKVAAETDMVYFNNLSHPTGAVVLSGDNRTGEGDGDDEKINIDFSLVPAAVQKIVIAISIHDAVVRKQNFGLVQNPFVRVVDPATNTEVHKFDLGEDFSTETAVIAGEFYRNGEEWKFAAKGEGVRGGLEKICETYGA